MMTVAKSVSVKDMLTYMCQGGQVETMGTVGRGNCCSAAADFLCRNRGSDNLQEMQNSSEISWFLNTDNYLKTTKLFGSKKANQSANADFSMPL